MTPAETLAAARLSPVGPFVPAREDWLRGWLGPCSPGDCDDGDVAICNGCIVDDRWVGEPNGIRLDLRRPECRDLLVRCGCPAWARDVPAAVWAWAGGVKIQGCGLMADAGERPVWLISRGWLLEEADGWYVPGDKIGWWPKNLETP